MSQKIASLTKCGHRLSGRQSVTLAENKSKVVMRFSSMTAIPTIPTIHLIHTFNWLIITSSSTAFTVNPSFGPFSWHHLIQSIKTFIAGNESSILNKYWNGPGSHYQLHQQVKGCAQPLVNTFGCESLWRWLSAGMEVKPVQWECLVVWMSMIREHWQHRTNQCEHWKPNAWAKQWLRARTRPEPCPQCQSILVAQLMANLASMHVYYAPEFAMFLLDE